MVSVYIANKYMNTFQLLPNRTMCEYHSEWMCDLCYEHSCLDSFEYKTIISTEKLHIRVCSNCIYSNNFKNIFSNEVEGIKNLIKNRLT
jgi:hypothetical protein